MIALPLLLTCWTSGLLLAARGSLVRSGLAMGLGTIVLMFALPIVTVVAEMLL